MSHLTMNTLRDYLLGRLPENEINFAAGHLDHCQQCQDTLVSLRPSGDTLITQLAGAYDPEPFAHESELAAVLASARRLEPGDDRASAPPAGLPGQLFEELHEYELVEQLGEGGMGIVFSARQVRLDRLVAVKLIRADRHGDPASAARFLRELKAIGKLCHPNIVRAYDAREIGGHHVLVMELVDGVDLAQLISVQGVLPVADACELMRQAAVGLQHAHAHGLIHRDIKPSNLMLAPGSVVKVLDLGLARLHADANGQTSEVTSSWAPESNGRAAHDELTGCRHIVGSLDYMPPEQLTNSSSVDARSDLFALGATLFKLLTGCAPYAAGRLATLEAKLAAISNPTSPLAINRSDLPADLVDLIQRLLARSPDDRPASAAEVAEALAPYAAGHNIQRYLHPPTALPQPSHASTNDRPSTSADSEDAAGASRSAPAVRPVQLLLAAAGLAAVICGVAVILKLQTPRGELLIEAPPEVHDQLQVTVRKGDEVHVVDAQRNWRIDLKDGRWDVELNDPDGQFELDESVATIKQDQVEVIRVAFKQVKQEDPAPAEQAAKPAPPDEFGLYTLRYPLKKGEPLKLSNVKYWVTPRYVGQGPQGRVVDERITVVFLDAEGSFWPVILKLSTPEAKRLRSAMAKAATASKGAQLPPGASPIDATLDLNGYQADENGRLILPPDVKCKVLPKFKADGPGATGVDPRPTLILEEPKRKLRPLIVRIHPEIAAAIAEQLAEIIAKK